MTMVESAIVYPRRVKSRRLLRWISHTALRLLTNVEVTGAENLPQRGPLLVVANHFSFIDPVAVINAAPWPLEFLGGTRLPNAPFWATWLPRLWGYYPVRRGTASRRALRAAEQVLNQGGVLGVFPEAGSWASVLRPARPGTAFLATRTGARVLPIGLDGFTDVFSCLQSGHRAKVSIRIGKPFGPFRTRERGRRRRENLERIGQEIMQRIAELLPAERRGHFSNDPVIREAAKGTEIYPWDEHPEI